MSSSIDASTIGLSFLPNEWKEKLLTKPLFVAIDRDGTLVPYQTEPGEAIVEPDVRAVVNDLADVPNVIAAVVSARGTAQLKKDFGNEKVIIASSYGLELSFPGGKVLVQPEVEAARNPLQQVKRAIEERLPASETRIFLEDHELSLCAHWHLTPPHMQHDVHKTFQDLLENYPSLHFRSLPSSYEVLPSALWDKGCALETITQALNIPLESYICIFIGDSGADEPAFKWVNTHNGLTIRVGPPLHTAALYQLPAPSAVLSFLRALIDERVERQPH